MYKIFGEAVLLLAGAFSLLTTWTALASPANFACRLGLSLANPGGGNEIRAQYAGFFFAVALACLSGLTGVMPRQTIYVVLVVIFAGLIAGRLGSLALDGGMAGYPPVIRALFAIDALGTAASIASLMLDHGA